MMHDIDDGGDYSNPAALDRQERKFRRAIAERDALMVLVEASRHLPGCKLTTDAYIDLKILHGNAEGDVYHALAHVRTYGMFYHSLQSDMWMHKQDEMTVRKVSLTTVWQRWRDVLAAREELKSIPEETFGDHPIKLVSRRRIDAQIAVARAEGLYDAVLRAFDGRAPRTWQQTLDIHRHPSMIRPPTRPLPTGGKPKSKSPTRSTYIGA